MNNQISSETCAKVYSVMNELELFESLPGDVKNFIIEKKKDLTFEYDKDKPSLYQITDKETLETLSYLYYEYINKDDDIREYLDSKYKENEMKYEEKKAEKYNVNVFENKENQENNNEETNNKSTEISTINEGKWDHKIWGKILSLFKRKK